MIRRMQGPVHPWIDLQEAPLYVMHFPVEASDDQVRDFCAVRETWAKTATHRCAWVADLTDLARVPPTQRKLFADHLKRFETHDVQYNQGSAIVVPSAMLRGVMTAVFWMSPPKFPNRAFATRKEAIAWAQERLRTGR